MHSTGNKYLLAAAICCFAAALAHLGCIVFGGDWYRFFGAGEQMARMAEQGLWYPTIVTSVIVMALLVWALYGLSGAGAIRSEEHTSELQSRENLVCRLLVEKK